MKKIVLVCTTVLICGSLAACGMQSSTKKANSSSKASSSKVVKKHKDQEKRKQGQKENTQLNSSTYSVSQSSQSTGDSDDNKVENALNQPYKGYATYRDYLNANGGDPDVQRQTDQMQTQYEIQNGYANSDGTPTAKGQSIIDAYNNGEFGN
ncbi:hypothetical protein [Limosilactobacillus vaginalis]|uniref:hypothetical protein n=1 Tax=Limosilactobacillus vaginalis TaxID=1633 RepID=UPI0023589B69|nr:hypothetical protein [Limosilactobacillus vaginalis]WCT58859.1 hypothetical protein PRK59_07735 [Limosilactobacillus vaginalis]